MSYKIAVASSDGKNIDLSFGSAVEFIIYEVNGTDYRVSEIRKFEPIQEECSAKTVCGTGCGTGGGNCSGGSIPKIKLISDCRCIVCKKIGFNAQKQLEKSAISSFDIDCGVKEALDKITDYIYKTDNHKSLRN